MTSSVTRTYEHTHEHTICPLVRRVDTTPSNKGWAETLHDILIDMNYIPSRADQCIWLKKNTELNLYEYIAVYVDDLYIAAQDPKEIINTLRSKYKLKVKGDGPLTYHLGAD